MEAFRALPKRGYKEIYRYGSQKRLRRYVTEFAGLRNKHRRDTLDRTTGMAQYTVGRRLICAALIGPMQRPTAAEFFSGMGLVRAALERCNFETVFANDIDETKAELYRDNWGDHELKVADIRALDGDDVPTVDLATASFPCVDLSLAGRRAGLDGSRSGVVFDFFRILEEMGDRAPDTVMIENVPGLLTSNGGRDLHAMTNRLAGLGYATAYGCVDAAAFVPQSRVRVFVIGSRARAPDIPPLPPARRFAPCRRSGGGRRVVGSVSLRLVPDVAFADPGAPRCKIPSTARDRLLRGVPAHSARSDSLGSAGRRTGRSSADDARRFVASGDSPCRSRRPRRALDECRRIRAPARRGGNALRRGDPATGDVRAWRRRLRSGGRMAGAAIPVTAVG